MKSAQPEPRGNQHTLGCGKPRKIKLDFEGRDLCVRMDIILGAILPLTREESFTRWVNSI